MMPSEFKIIFRKLHEYLDAAESYAEGSEDRGARHQMASALMCLGSTSLRLAVEVCDVALLRVVGDSFLRSVVDGLNVEMERENPNENRRDERDAKTH